MKLTQEYLKECLDYNESTGIFTWRTNRPEHHFGNKGAYLTWQKKCSGKEAGHKLINRKVFESIKIKIKDTPYQAHNLVWLYVYGRLPNDGFIIDHKDGNPLNNCLSNLREVTPSINQRNRKLNKNNTSGFTGISFTDDGYWKASGKVEGKSVYIGVFKEKQEAVNARNEWQKQQGGYSERHGT